MCVVSLRILYGERSRGSGGGGGCDGVVARAVERQRVQVFGRRDCRSRRFQGLDCRNVGAVEAMVGSCVCKADGETSSPPIGGELRESALRKSFRDLELLTK